MASGIREAYGKFITKLGSNNKNIVLLELYKNFY